MESCPTCGSKVRVAGDTTKYFVPVESDVELHYKELYKLAIIKLGTLSDEELKAFVNKKS